MTELTSQFYTRALAGGDPELFLGSAWTRVRVLDPATLAEAPAGTPGLLAIFDLANLGSAVHLLTEDLGSRRGRGLPPARPRAGSGAARLLADRRRDDAGAAAGGALNLDPRPASVPASIPHPMLRDHALPPSFAAVETRREAVRGFELERAVWRPGDLARLARHLAGTGAAALRDLGPEPLLAAWSSVVEQFRDPRSGERRALAEPLAALARLSPAGLAAGLETVLAGAAGAPARRVLAARELDPEPGFALVVLASNLPALAVQPLWRALARGRPALLKSPSAEPLFAAAFVAALAAREPRLGDAVAAVTWRGGDAELEAPLLAAAREVVAYGEAETIADLARRAPGKVVAHGPKTSLGLVAAGAAPRDAAAGLARDIALFDQRGCLSVQAVYTTGDATALADELAAALAERALAWPPGEPTLAETAAVQQVRGDAELRGLHQPALPLLAGTVIVEPELFFRPSPGLRTVRVHPLNDWSELEPILGPWSGRLQGVAASGALPSGLEERLRGLGVSRLAPAGELQHVGVDWDDGAARIGIVGAAVSGRPNGAGTEARPYEVVGVAAIFRAGPPLRRR